MAPAYRFEISSNNRAGCQNKECKDAGLKIVKGDLRFGTWVEYTFGEREIQSWKWRHWGCITPKVIENLINTLEARDLDGDLDIIDGYEDLPEEWKEKVRTMLKEGHVPDEDWKGDVEQNRPGKRGSHKKATSAKEKVRNDDDNGNNDMAEGTPTKAKAAKGRSKKVKAEATGNDGGDDNVPLRSGGSAPKKRKRRAGSVADEDDDETAAYEQAARPPKQPKSGHLALMQAGKGDEDTLEEKPAKKSRSKKTKVEKETPEAQTIEGKGNGLDGRPSRVAQNVRKMRADVLKSEDLDNPAETKPSNSPEESKKALKTERLDHTTDSKTKFGAKADPDTVTKPAARRGKAKKVKVEDAEEDAAPEPEKEEPKSKGRKSKANKGTKVEHAEEEADVDTANASENVGSQTAPEPQGEDKPKVKAGRKKGLAKTIAKPKIKPDY